MSREEKEAVAQRLTASLEAIMTEAQQQMIAAEIAELVQVAELAVWGIPAMRWCPPGLGAARCPDCGQPDRWFQRLDTGVVRCRCQLPG